MVGESVWDYPRPPRVEDDARHIIVRSGPHLIADTRSAKRVLETSHPPVFYISPSFVDVTLLSPNPKQTFCEFKGYARYWDLSTNSARSAVAWTFSDPSPGYESIAGWFAFYPDRVECYVDRQLVQPQEGVFYGGWITAEIEGPFKGGPGTSGW